ncbi:MAG: DUF3021 domain-containing protein [Lachnospiraceae bacterium]|nr:DUF3021 domain-containing protein [Lachnospiraceae bacterium]
MSILKKWLSKEIDIELKACLYFFCILFYYVIFRIIEGSMEANILVMAEMVCTAYILGCIQTYLLHNFDEGEHFGKYEFGASIGCCLVYSGMGYWGKWFDRQLLPSLIFFGYLFLCYVCVFLAYKIKRSFDTKKLNQDLEAFKRDKKHIGGR